MDGRSWSIRRILVLGYPVVILATIAGIAAAGYLIAEDATRRAARAAMGSAAETVTTKIASFLDPVEKAVEATALMLERGRFAWNDPDALETHFLALLRQIDGVDGIYYGTSEGAFVYVTRGAPGGVPYVSKIIEASEGLRAVRLRQRDADYRLIEESDDPTDRFDPRLRPWYRLAVDNARQGWTDPYVYYMSAQPGVSFARAANCHESGLVCVVGIDVSLAGMSGFLDRLAVGAQGGALLMTAEGRLLAAPNAAAFFRARRALETAPPELPEVDGFPDPVPAAAARALFADGEPSAGPDRGVSTFEHDGRRFFSVGLALTRPGLHWLAVVYAPRDDFFGWFDAFQQRALGIAIAIGLVATLLAVVFSDRLLASLARIRVNAERANRPDGEAPAAPASRLREVRDLEEALVAMIAERRRAEGATQAALAQAVAANQAKSEFLAHMSHELRTPLNAIVGFVELLRLRVAAGLPEKERGYLSDIGAASHHLSDVIASILDFAAAENGRLRLNEQTVELDEIVAGARDILARAAEEKRIAVAFEPAAGLALHVDPAKLRQILLNLLSNAIKYTPEGGHIAIAAAREPDGLAISVTDDGIGMSPDEVERAQQPFARITANPYIASRSGIGLGLSIARALTELHGGTMTLASARGAGTTATVRLPASRLRAPAWPNVAAG